MVGDVRTEFVGSLFQLLFGVRTGGQRQYRQVQKGETEFVQEYLKRFKDYEIIKNIPLNTAQIPCQYNACRA